MRILCIRLSSLGDVAHALCALATLRAARPDAFIAWVVEERFADLLRGHPQIDKLITVPRRRWGRMLKNPLRWFALREERMKMARRIRALELDATIDFQSSFKSAWLVRASGAAERIGFDQPVGREGSWRVQTDRVAVPTSGAHRCERDLALLGPLGIEPTFAPPVLPVDDDVRLLVDEALAGRLTGGPVVVMHPGTSAYATFKRWPPERYVVVGDALVGQRGADVLIAHGPGEEALADGIAAGMSERCTVIRPVAGLRGLIELLRRADLFIGSDSGPMHIASALGRPVLALFGPKDPEQTGPWCTRSIVVTVDVPCRPCTQRRCRDPICMTRILADDVAAAALDLLDGGGDCPATGA